MGKCSNGKSEVWNGHFAVARSFVRSQACDGKRKWEGEAYVYKRTRTSREPSPSTARRHLRSSLLLPMPDAYFLYATYLSMRDAMRRDAYRIGRAGQLGVLRATRAARERSSSVRARASGRRFGACRCTDTQSVSVAIYNLVKLNGPRHLPPWCLRLTCAGRSEPKPSLNLLRSNSSPLQLMMRRYVYKDRRSLDGARLSVASVCIYRTHFNLSRADLLQF